MKKHPDPAPKDFIRASGRLLMRGAETIRLIGINFPAYGWKRSGYTRQEILGARNFRAEDYRRVAAMGMNVVRLNMSYLLFERDENPYRYDAEGWDWLDEQVNAARAADGKCWLTVWTYTKNTTSTRNIGCIQARRILPCTTIAASTRRNGMLIRRWQACSWKS